MWHLGSDERRAHLGAALGYVGEDESAPTYRVGRALHERTWQDGKWGGPEDGRPESGPDFLRAICSCGWTSPALVDMSAVLPLNPERPAVNSLQGQDRARAYWLAHALAATSPDLPGPAAQAYEDVRVWSGELARRQPLAALAHTRALRELADAYEGLAVRHARALEIPWEDIGAAAGTTRQQVWRKHRAQPPLTDEGDDILTPVHLPSYQHENGHPPYTITAVGEVEPR